MNYITSLTRFQFTYSNLLMLKLRNFFLCTCCCSKSTNGRRLHQVQKQYIKGKLQLDEELDLIKLIKNIRYSQMLMKIQLPRYQRLFLNYSKSNVIMIKKNDDLFKLDTTGVT